MTYFDRIKKANPYHDSAGRFAPQNGAASISIGPAYAKTIARLKAQLGAKEKNASEITEGELLPPRNRAYRITKVSKLTSWQSQYAPHVVELELLNPTTTPTPLN